MKSLILFTLLAAAQNPSGANALKGEEPCDGKDKAAAVKEVLKATPTAPGVAAAGSSAASSEAAQKTDAAAKNHAVSGLAQLGILPADKVTKDVLPPKPSLGALPPEENCK